MTKNKLKNILILENWTIMLFAVLIDNFAKIVNSFSFFRAVFIFIIAWGTYLLLKKRFFAYKNDEKNEWRLFEIIIVSVFVNATAIDSIISAF